MNKMKRNADLLGLDTVMHQSIEECGELIQAICKYARANGQYQKTTVTPSQALDELTEEIADVEICVKQLKYLLGINTSMLKEFKLERTYNRYDCSAEE